MKVMRDNYELFAIINEIIKALMTAGENDFSQQLEEALSISTVPGEILGEVRLRLREIPRYILVVAQVDKKANTALKYLDKILGS
jgi:hypothetical protein